MAGMYGDVYVCTGSVYRGGVERGIARVHPYLSDAGRVGLNPKRMKSS